MISAADFIELPYASDLTEAGISYARRILPRLHRAAGRRLYDTLRRTVAATAVDLAVRRYLTEHGVRFGVRAPRPFSEPERYEIEIGGRACELITFLISRQAQIDALAADPSLALAAPALVPLARQSAEDVRGNNIYLFAMVSAVVMTGAARKAIRTPAGSREFWLHAMPAEWIRPRAWTPMQSLELKSDAPYAVRLELSGEDQAGNSIDLTIDVPPRQRLEVDCAFYSLTHIHVDSRPAGKIGVRSPARRVTHVVDSNDWENLWLQGRDIRLLGWISHEHFQMRARQIPEGRHVFQFSQTKTKNLAMDVANLKPVHLLFESGRNDSA